VFTRSAALYDLFYDWKDYADEARTVTRLVREIAPDARFLLDVACGTGRHLQHLAENFEVEGLDLDEELLRVARERNPGIPLQADDMATFSLGRRFDVITCLFSSIGYLHGVCILRQALSNMAAHLRPGGVLLVEPWFGQEEWIDGHIGAHFIDRPELKAARMNVASSRQRLSILNFHYLVATPEGISQFTEEHSLFLFSDKEYREAFEDAGMVVSHDAEGLEGRGLYVGSPRRLRTRRAREGQGSRRGGTARLGGANWSRLPRAPGG
jgi:SAM-dependent methyltransferase